MDLRPFYERSYSHGGPDGEIYARWRQLSAVAKTDHVLALSAELVAEPARVLDIGCGDGAVIARLHEMRPTWSFAGVEIAERAVELARARCPDADIRLYEGMRLPYERHAFDLAILSHVIEHVVDPIGVLLEAARVSSGVIVEVPLEANVSTLRASKKQVARNVGHIQRLSRHDVRTIVTTAGLRVTAEISDPLGRESHTFFADSSASRARASAKWAARTAVHDISTSVAQRLFTVHYACLCQ